MRDLELNQMTRVVIAVVPLFAVATNFEIAIRLSVVVLSSILICEVCFLLVRRGANHNLHALLSLLFLSIAIQAFALLGTMGKLPVGGERLFAFVLMSAFLLTETTVTTKRPFLERARGWVSFGAVLLVVGISQQWIGSRQLASPVPFFVLGGLFALLIFLGRRKRI